MEIEHRIFKVFALISFNLSSSEFYIYAQNTRFMWNDIIIIIARVCPDIIIIALVAQRDGRCPIPGNFQGQVGRGSEQPDPVYNVPAHCRGVGLYDL